jgi:hypothetical protein
VLDSKQFREQWHDNSDYFREISQGSGIDITEHSDPDAKIKKA